MIQVSVHTRERGELSAHSDIQSTGVAVVELQGLHGTRLVLFFPDQDAAIATMSEALQAATEATR